jgi:putative acetyltransferase
MSIRPTIAQDHAAIGQTAEATFGQPEESLLVDALRQAGDVAFEYVATDCDLLIGHIAMSRLVSPAGCLALAPLAVRPDWQRRGVGSSLVRAATKAAQNEGWVAAFVLGDPNYYGRFGYGVENAHGFKSPYPAEFMAACVFDDDAFRSLPRELVYPAAF